MLYIVLCKYKNLIFNFIFKGEFFVNFNHGIFLLIFISTVQKTINHQKMLKKLNLIKDKESSLSIKDFEIINVNRKKGALGVGSFATVKLALHKHS